MKKNNISYMYQLIFTERELDYKYIQDGSKKYVTWKTARFGLIHLIYEVWIFGRIYENIRHKSTRQSFLFFKLNLWSVINPS